MIGNIQKASIGTKIQLTITKNNAVFPLTGATVTLLYKKYDGSTGTWTATLDSPTTGVVSYTTTSVSNLDVVGEWEIQAKVVLSGNTFYSVKESFNVLANVS